MLNYQPLRYYLKMNGMSIHSLRREIGFTTNIAVNLKNDVPVHLSVIHSICTHLDVPIEQVVHITKE